MVTKNKDNSAVKKTQTLIKGDTATGGGMTVAQQANSRGHFTDAENCGRGERGA